MSYAEFYCDPVNGSNLNAGSTTSGSPILTNTNGAWDGSVTFTCSGSPDLSGVTAGMFASVTADATTTVTGFTGLITAVNNTTKVVSISGGFFLGSRPSSGSGYTLRVGGAWAGPSGTTTFPFAWTNFNQLVGAVATGSHTRFNMRSNATFNMTSGISLSSSGVANLHVRGYTSTAGDGGYATFDGGTSGSSYVLWSVSNTNIFTEYMKFQNNGATGGTQLVSASPNTAFFTNCYFGASRGYSFQCSNQSMLWNCYATGGLAGGFNLGGASTARRCVSRQLLASAIGFTCNSNFTTFDSCIAVGNLSSPSNGVGFQASGVGTRFVNCVARRNAGGGISVSGVNQAWIENCVLANNGGFGIQANSTSTAAIIKNCGFFSNSSGRYNTSFIAANVDDITDFAADPFVDADNGDFTLASDNRGLIVFPMSLSLLGYSTDPSSFEDHGAIQSEPPSGGGGSGVSGSRIFTGF